MWPKRTGLKVQGGGRMLTPTHATYELKHRVVLCLNKLADRDTYQIGAEELEKIAEGLKPEGIAPFLSCVIDTDSEQKSAVRKECIRVLGTLARFHGSLMLVHIGKMVASIIKRLKDSDSAVRDSCVETAGVLALTMGSNGGGEGGFVPLVKPFFESLGEQNRYVQTGAAMCLTRVIDEATEPPASLLAQMLSRVVKLLKNQHFMAKPDVVGLIRSIVQAGGATTEHTQQFAVTSITEALKCSDWKTRKAASLALAEIAVNCGSTLGYLKTTCICSLESCRFDKVKPVRDSVAHALQCWKDLAGTHSSDPSEAVSSNKVITSGGYSDLTCNSDGVWIDRASSISGTSSSSIKNSSLTIRKKCPNQMQDHRNRGSNGWHIEVSLPKSQVTPLADANLKETHCSSIPKEYQPSEDATRFRHVTCESKATDGNTDCSNVSNFVSGCRETKHVAADTEYIDDGSSANIISINSGPETEEVNSAVTDASSHKCSLSASSELTFIRKQLLDIKTQQSELINLLEAFMGNTTANLLSINSKVHNLEDAVDEIAQAFTQKGSNLNVADLKYLKKKLSAPSFPRLSTCAAKPSFDYTQQSTFSSNKNQFSRENLLSRSGSSSPTQEGLNLWRDQNIKLVRNTVELDIQKKIVRNQLKENENLFSATVSSICSNKKNIENEAVCWEKINDHICSSGLELAYDEALSSGDFVRLLELMNTTGPVLDKLSHELTGKVLDILPRQFLNHRFISSMIPCLQQVVALSQLQGSKQPFLSEKAQVEFLHALLCMTDAEYLDCDDRLSIVKLAVKLSKVWGEGASRRITLSRSSNGSIKMANQAAASPRASSML